MRKIITLTLLVDFASCLVMFIIYSTLDSFATGVYSGLFAFGNILIPTLAVVVFFTKFRNRMILINPIRIIVSQILILCLALNFLLIIWAVIDVWFFEKLTFESILDDYKSQFLGFLPVVFAIAVFLPTFDYFLYGQRKLILEK